MTDKELERITLIFEQRQARITTEALKKIGKVIKDIGETDIAKLRNIKRYDSTIKDIAIELQKNANVNAEAIYKLYADIAEKDFKAYEELIGSVKDNESIKAIILAEAKATAGEMRNLSKTSVVGFKLGDEFLPLGKAYKQVVDKAVQAVATGATDYQSEIYSVVKDIGQSGLRVQYESGVTRRLDSAVRQNVLDGVKHLTTEVSKQVGEDIGADGVEISAHGACAPDHLPYQGKQFTNAEFDRLQNSLDRPFEEYNCTHSVYPIIMGISNPVYSDKELKAITQDNTSKVEYQGKEYTKYEATQVQRQLETKARYLMDEKTIAQAAGNHKLASEVNKKINAVKREYKVFSKATGVQMKAYRMG